MATEDRTFGYKVVWENVGRQHTAQLPLTPGTMTPLQVNVSPQGAPVRSATPPINTVYSSEPRAVNVAEPKVLGGCTVIVCMWSRLTTTDQITTTIRAAITAPCIRYSG